MRNSFLLGVLMAATLLVGIFLFYSMTGNATAQIISESSTVDNGILTVELGGEEFVSSTATVFMSISHEGKVINSKILTFESIANQGSKDYRGPATFSLEIDKIFDNYFNESGTYELFIQIPKLDRSETTQFIVE